MLDNRLTRDARYHPEDVGRCEKGMQKWCALVLICSLLIVTLIGGLTQWSS